MSELTIKQIENKKYILEKNISDLVNKFISEIKPIKGINIKVEPIYEIFQDNSETYLYTSIKTEIII